MRETEETSEIVQMNYKCRERETVQHESHLAIVAANLSSPLPFNVKSTCNLTRARKKGKKKGKEETSNEAHGDAF